MDRSESLTMRGSVAAVLFLATLAVLLLPFGAWAEETPTPKPVTITVEGHVLAQRTWSLGAEARDLPGARLQAEIKARRWRIAGRADATGLPGEFVRDKPETFKAIECYLAGAYDLATLPSVLTAGPAAVVGVGISIETQDGIKPTMPKRITAGIGGRVSWSGGWAYVVVGQHQALRGVSAMITWQTRLSDRLFNIGTAAIGSTSYFATMGVGVRFR